LLDVATDGAVDLANRLDPPPPLRIAVSTHAATPARPVADVRSALDRAVGILRDLGHTVVDRDPPYGASLSLANTTRYLAGIAADVAGLVDADVIESRTRVFAGLGRRLPAGAVRWARRQGEEFGNAMTEFFSDVDLLVTPTMPVLPRKAGCLADTGLLRTMALMLPCAAYTGPWNGAGLPAMSLPVGVTSDGLPVGVQLIGPARSEARLLGLAASVEPVAGWLDRRVGS
jgi:amidase